MNTALIDAVYIDCRSVGQSVTADNSGVWWTKRCTQLTELTEWV